jgi:hypothetical protein
MVSHIASFTISRLDDLTLSAFEKLDYDNCSNSTEYRDLYMRLMGYNPSSDLKNKQQCVLQCGQFGYGCPGHPIRLDLKTNYLSPFRNEIMTPICKIFCASCGHIICPLANIAKQSIFSFVKNLKPSCAKQHHLISGCNLFVRFEDTKSRSKIKKGQERELTDTDKLLAYLNLLDATELLWFNVDKASLLRLVSREIVLLPLALQPSLDGITKSIHTRHHFSLIRLLKEVNGSEMHNKTQLLTLNSLMDKLLVSETEEKSSFLQMCEGKEGLFRGSALRKRAYETARAVLVPDSDTKSAMGILTCPKVIMQTLKYSYIVSPHNIEFLQNEAGRNLTHIVREGRNIKVNGFIKLKLGDKVLTNIKPGDSIVFNRHPTLHDLSMVGYIAEQSNSTDESNNNIQDNCLELHQLNMPHHNADLDGDEGNVHLGETSGCRIETQYMHIKYRIMGKKSGEPAIGIFYNGIVGCYMLSLCKNLGHLFNILVKALGLNRYNGFKSLAEQIAYYEQQATLNNIPTRSGNVVFSMLLPLKLNYTRGDVVIRNGFLVSGFLTKEDVSNKLVSAIFEIDRWEMTYFFVNQGYVVSCMYASMIGITVGIAEYLTTIEFDKELLARVNRFVAVMEEQKRTMTESSKQKAEAKISAVLGHISSAKGIGREVKDLFERRKQLNRPGNMADISFLSEARGTIENISSAIASIGQQFNSTDNRRMSSETRLSPFSPVGSKDITDNGFILNSYTTGLTAKEVVVVACIGRIQAFKVYSGTPIAGDQYARTSRHLGETVTNDKLEVISREGKIVSFLYGTGIDPIYKGRKANPLGKQEFPVSASDLLNSFQRC